jgi:germacradienol/geosmin synthase
MQDRLPDPIDYVEMRRRTAGTGLSSALARLSMGPDIPAELFDHPTMRALIGAFADSVDFRNDIFSYEKEIAREHEINNAVLVFRRFLEIGLKEAVDLVNRLLTARLQQFEQIAVDELPVMFDALALGEKARARILAYVRHLEDWSAGDLQWYLKTRRYGAPTPRRPLLGPTGLGTSSARLVLAGRSPKSSPSSDN